MKQNIWYVPKNKWVTGLILIFAPIVICFLGNDMIVLGVFTLLSYGLIWKFFGKPSVMEIAIAFDILMLLILFDLI